VSAASFHSPAAEPRHSGVTRVSPRRVRESAERAPTPRPSGPELEVRFLSELARAHGDVRAAIDAALSTSSPRGPDLVMLRGELRQRTDQLLDALLTLSEERDAMDALVPFVFFVDEQVEYALAVSTDPGNDSWQQLQRDLFPERRAEGGDVFFERASALLSEQTPRPTVLAAYLFCLKANFRGRLADEPVGAEDLWIRALAERLPSAAPRRAHRAPTWRAPRRTSTHLVTVVGGVLVWHFVVSLWAYLR
jgi:hypothetical protein